MQDAPEEILTGVLERCPNCGAARYVVAKQLSKPVMETPQSSLNLQYINVHSSSGKIGAKDSTKVRAHVMRNYKMIRHSRKHALPTGATSPQNTCMCRRSSTTGKLISHQVQSMLGEGRCDPFLRLETGSLPKRYHELMDHNVTVIWSRIRTPEFGFAFARRKLPRVAQDPTVLHVFLFLALAHLESVRDAKNFLGGKKKARLEQLHQKGEAIRRLSDTIREGNYHESDELIEIILLLAMNETEEEEEPADWSPFVAPLKSLQWLNIYGTRTYCMPHLVAAQKMIKRRGGTRNIHTFAVSWLISCSELISCAATLDSPQHPLLDPFGQDIEYCPLSTFSNIRNHTHDSGTMAYGLSYLQTSGLYDDFINVFLKMRDYSETLQLYENSSDLPEPLADNRNWVLYHLLSLPPASELPRQDDLLIEDSQRTMQCYEACRIAALMYCIHVVFPTPRSLQARRKLLPLLKEAIQGIDLLMASKGMVELVLWCVVIGGIAASGQNERVWFLVQQNILSTILRLKEWPEVKVVMKRFAWVNSACDPGGEALFGTAI